MEEAITKTQFDFPGLINLYKGKVRDVYNIEDKLLVMVVSDRISAFDAVLPRGIPYKGQVLNQIANKFLDATTDIVPNWKLSSPDPNVTIGVMADPFRVEMVIRGYLTGHAWREYKAGKRTLCGVPMGDGMKEHDRFPSPMITPATKAEEGHDEDISREDIISHGIVSKADYLLMEDYTYRLFERGTVMAAEKGLILVDTKYEFGKKDGRIYLIDEIHTPDSSRYFYADGYEERQAKGAGQKQLSKEFVREWLMDHDFQGLEGQVMPEIPDEFVQEVTDRYVELYENITGEEFIRSDYSDTMRRIEDNVNNFLKSV